MTRILVLLGIMLVALGTVSYANAQGASPTALIPAVFGTVLLVLAFFAGRSPRPRPWYVGSIAWMALGIAGSMRGLLQLPALIGGAEVARPSAVTAQALMAMLCIGFAVTMITKLARMRTSSGPL